MDFLKQAKSFYIAEINDYITYRELAKATKDKELKEIFEKISLMELEHSKFWKSILRKNKVEIPKEKVNSFRLKLLKFLSKFINPIFIISFLEAGESNAVKSYYQFLNEDFLNDGDKEKLKKIMVDELEHESIFEKEAEKFGISNIRDFILGMNDGLVEILGVITGMSAVYINNPLMVAMSGLIVGVAGSLSMGIGAFISVKSQRQVNEAIREKMEILLNVNPKEALKKLKEKLINSDIPENLVDDIVKKFEGKENILKGLLIKDIEENEIKSALFTGFAYLVGVFFPVFPFFFVPNSLIGLPIAIISVGIVISVVATFISVLSGISIKKKIVEMVSAILFATIVSFGFGKLMQYVFGVEIGE
ncbi:MAG: rubrerythrin family protein [Persephonella sp.]|nr:MAG: rubrerythrin family protein [Persephonella sp.]